VEHGSSLLFRRRRPFSCGEFQRRAQAMLPLMLIMVFDGIIRRPETTWQPYFILFYFIVDTSWLLVDPGAVRR
jgi:uncharacterized membrane protein